MIFNPKNIAVKIIAIAVCVCFLWQDVAWAAPAPLRCRAGGSDFLRTPQVLEQMDDSARDADSRADGAGGNVSAQAKMAGAAEDIVKKIGLPPPLPPNLSRRMRRQIERGEMRYIDAEKYDIFIQLLRGKFFALWYRKKGKRWMTRVAAVYDCSFNERGFEKIKPYLRGCGFEAEIDEIRQAHKEANEIEKRLIKAMLPGVAQFFLSALTIFALDQLIMWGKRHVWGSPEEIAQFVGPTFPFVSELTVIIFTVLFFGGLGYIWLLSEWDEEEIGIFNGWLSYVIGAVFGSMASIARSSYMYGDEGTNILMSVGGPNLSALVFFLVVPATFIIYPAIKIAIKIARWWSKRQPPSTPPSAASSTGDAAGAADAASNPAGGDTTAAAKGNNYIPINSDTNIKPGDEVWHTGGFGPGIVVQVLRPSTGTALVAFGTERKTVNLVGRDMYGHYFLRLERDTAEKQYLRRKEELQAWLVNVVRSANLMNKRRVHEFNTPAKYNLNDPDTMAMFNKVVKEEFDPKQVIVDKDGGMVIVIPRTAPASAGGDTATAGMAGMRVLRENSMPIVDNGSIGDAASAAPAAAVGTRSRAIMAALTLASIACDRALTDTADALRIHNNFVAHIKTMRLKARNKRLLIIDTDKGHAEQVAFNMANDAGFRFITIMADKNWTDRKIIDLADDERDNYDYVVAVTRETGVVFTGKEVPALQFFPASATGDGTLTKEIRMSL